jgi:hypothetical protein
MKPRNPLTPWMERAPAAALAAYNSANGLLAEWLAILDPTIPPSLAIVPSRSRPCGFPAPDK